MRPNFFFKREPSGFRWMHQHGFHVERRFGWDTHGLPVEYEIDKALGIKGPEDVARMGIEAYNGECRKIVMRYAEEWERATERMGRWIDFRNDYKTLYPWYMESIWWVFRQLWDKGLIYKGFRVMPYSTGCATPLSNFEASQDYKEVVDPAVTVNFPLVVDGDEGQVEGVRLLAWTTTPWTLPSNLALCVHPDHDYVRVKVYHLIFSHTTFLRRPTIFDPVPGFQEVSSGNQFILMEKRLLSVFKAEEDFEVLERMKGRQLENKRYEPIFDYFAHLKDSGAFRVLCDPYVTEESGTGVVHQVGEGAEKALPT